VNGYGKLVLHCAADAANHGGSDDDHDKCKQEGWLTPTKRASAAKIN